ncbi:1914_t:CDS:2, partial [Dentiscutata heterogama]
QYEELCEMHLNLMKEMEIELVTEDNHNMEDDNIEQFAASISNPVDNVNKEGFNDVVNHSHHENRFRHCGVCGQIGYNARTCNLDSSSKQINNLILESHNRENESRLPLPLPLPIANKNDGDLNLISSVDKDLANNKSCRCGICRQIGHNARTCDAKR